ncbi:hypothetical protein H5410_008199 [Solanum commersonii]|uniref:Uncharacterized protein n=1 Tax=Solanum commersonii TaxID=4109 RepID=A0A9J6AE96_SOLCO|nr:hypothetical protein H5410_008199 [Solanum commersonii]
MESEVAVSDDLMEPSIQKYVTFRRGTDMEEQESSGSNSVVGGQQNWLSPSSWEPNSADSTDCWPSSKSYSRDDNKSPLGFQRHAISEIGHDMEEGKSRVNVKRRESDNQQTGIGRGREEDANYSSSVTFILNHRSLTTLKLTYRSRVRTMESVTERSPFSELKEPFGTKGTEGFCTGSSCSGSGTG